MKLTITIRKVLDEEWASEQDLDDMDDVQILDLVQEDVLGLLDGAEWKVERSEEPGR